MSFRVICLFLCATVVAIHAQSADKSKNGEDNARIFLSTFTVILSTVTSTATTTSVTTCTTSAAALTTCSAGRRRRGLLYEENESNASARGLYYDDQEREPQDKSVLVPSSPVKRSAEPNQDELKDSNPSLDKTNLIPLTVQSGFSLPEGFSNGNPRFKLAYGTTTVTTTATSLSTRSLTALCASTTNYSLCSNNGK